MLRAHKHNTSVPAIHEVCLSVRCPPEQQPRPTGRPRRRNQRWRRQRRRCATAGRTPDLFPSVLVAGIHYSSAGSSRCLQRLLIDIDADNGRSGQGLG